MAINSTSGTFGATGNGLTFIPEPAQDLKHVVGFNVSVWGTFVGTAVLERSFDAGTTWIPVLRPGGNTAVSYTAPSSEVLYEPEDSVMYRLRCSAWTSGTINYRLSK